MLRYNMLRYDTLHYVAGTECPNNVIKSMLFCVAVCVRAFARSLSQAAKGPWHVFTTGKGSMQIKHDSAVSLRGGKVGLWAGGRVEPR